MTDERDADVVVREMDAELARCKEPLTFVLQPATALTIAAFVDLALRHPGVAAMGSDGPIRAKTFVRLVRDYFVRHGAVAVVETMDGGTLGGF